MIQVNDNRPERAVLMGLNSSRSEEREIEYEWREFAELVGAAGATIAARVAQNRETPDPALFFGTGKVEELAAAVREHDADLVVSLQELSPVQVRNLEERTGVRVIDRTNLILDIFAQRAQSHEGKLQVELAQLSYALPRLSGAGLVLSRLGGGIGTRGPGETKLETDRRTVRTRIADLRRELAEVRRIRSVQRHLREKNEIPTVAMVGYTNAGKSTLFNRLTAAGTSAKDRLFDTLDPLSRQLTLSNRRTVIFLDTVGFISKLPHQLVAAFRATLEETIRASLILHVMDAEAPDLLRRYRAVQEVLAELEVQEKETLLVLNKIDRLESEPAIQRMAKEWAAVPVSAMTGAGIEALLAAVQRKLESSLAVIELLLPFTEAGLLDQIHRRYRVLETSYTEAGIQVQVELERVYALQFQRFRVDGPEPPC
jgi:GTP-binding protein HflX